MKPSIKTLISAALLVIALSLPVGAQVVGPVTATACVETNFTVPASGTTNPVIFASPFPYSSTVTQIVLVTTNVVVTFTNSAGQIGTDSNVVKTVYQTNTVVAPSLLNIKDLRIRNDGTNSIYFTWANIIVSTNTNAVAVTGWNTLTNGVADEYKWGVIPAGLHFNAAGISTGVYTIHVQMLGN